MVSVAFEVEEEECFVALLINAGNVYGAADGNTKLISMRIRLRRDRDAEMVGIKRGVAQIVVNIAMQAATAGLGHHVDHISSAPTVLRREGILLDLELLNVVWRWHVNNPAPAFAGIPCTVQKERICSEVPATKVKERNILVGGALLSA